MTPVTVVEGNRKLDPVSERNIAERRFSALASAVREHEALVRRRQYGIRPQDQALYRRLRQICGELDASCSGSGARGGGDGSARTETVSATLRETTCSPSPEFTMTSSSVELSSVPSSPGRIPACFR